MRHALLLSCLLAAAAAAAAPPPARAQTDSATSLIGVVRDESGRAIEGVNVFLLETLEGALSGADGRFRIRTAHRGAATLVARRIGFHEMRRAVTVPSGGPLELVLGGAPVVLAAITAQAGRYTGGDSADATLTSLEVVTTPGAAADVYRAIQTFPGLQQVDEGAGLFVRGGDVAETKILLNDAVVISPYRNESPTGGVFGVFDPFQLAGITFSSGGFGARYGDALSGILALETRGRPPRVTGGATAGLAAISATAALPLPHGFGVRGTGTRSNTRLMFEVNGTTRDFSRVPEGRDLAGGVFWNYRPTGEVRVYYLNQWNTVGVTIDEASFSGAFTSYERTTFAVASWRDRLGPVRGLVSLGRSGVARDQSFGAFALSTDEIQRQAHARLIWTLSPTWTLTAGGEAERRESGYAGVKTLDEYDPGPGAPTVTFGSTRAGTRTAAFTELDWQALGLARVTAGVRTDRSSLTGARTTDPRLAAALALRGVTFTLAWGIYHQVPSPILFERTIGDTTLASMRARHLVAGLQSGDPSATFARVEMYRKTYDDLAQRDRDGFVVAGGAGSTHGADVFLKLAAPGWTLRAAYSYVNAERTDPDAGTLTRSPFDITHTASVISERTWRNTWRLSLAYRYASGRPFTPVTGATFDSTRQLHVPSYGAAFSDRLPGFFRVDVAASWLHSFWPNSLTVLFVAVNNVFDRRNVYDYRYNADYTVRTPVRSLFKRSVYFGATINWT